jgi:ATP-dependent RNA helicase DHX36
VDLDLIERLLQAICCEGPFAASPAASRGAAPDVAGAILVFLPGWDEIMRLKDRLETSLPSSRCELA